MRQSLWVAENCSRKFKWFEHLSLHALILSSDKTFKKVDEGIEEFNSIYDKIYSSQNASQKDKLEEHLKREIKKLQKHRDQIKSWAAGNEIKDKTGLLEQRKRIEKVRDSPTIEFAQHHAD